MRLLVSFSVTSFDTRKNMSNQAPRSWLDSFQAELKSYALRGDYKSALQIAKKALKAHPHELVCQYQYAKLLGDFADELPPAKKRKLKAEASIILRRLVRQMGAMPASQRFGICVNYYYQTEKFREMCRFGKKFVKFDPQLGYYAQAMGSGLVAFEEYEKQRLASSRAWALKSVEAWKKYKLKNEKYYFAHYSYAKALALAGMKKEAHISLRTAAKLGKRPLSDWEFADVRKILL